MLRYDVDANRTSYLSIVLAQFTSSLQKQVLLLSKGDSKLTIISQHNIICYTCWKASYAMHKQG